MEHSARPSVLHRFYPETVQQILIKINILATGLI